MEQLTLLGLSALQAETLRVMLIIAAVSAAYCFVVGEITRNNSQMDKLWSVLPPVYAWVVAGMGGFEARLVLMAVLATVWGARLTFNFALKGAYTWKFWSGEEDYRWPWLRKRKEFQPRWKWVVFDFVFISIYQNLLVLLTTLPAVAAMGSLRPLGWLDIVAAVLMAGFIAYETVADVQQWRFQSTKWGMINSGMKLEDLPAPYNKGFNTTGLWRLSRHPNYFAEQAIWVSFYIFSIAAGAGIINWSGCGALLLILLFMGSSTLGEYISKSKYPEYAAYVKSVNRFFPGRPKLICAIAIFFVALSCSKAADTVVLGTIRTAEEDNPVVEAVAVKDGKFIYVGDKAGVKAYIKEGVTEVIDHTGKGMVMPGCFDGHAHYIMPMALANMKGGVLFDANDDKAAVLKKVDAAALEAASAGKKCLFGFGWNFYIIRMSEQEQISLAELDAVSHGLSVALFDSGGHNMYCNTECFRRCGIIDDKGNVLIKEIPGGLLELDEKGHLTGFIDERVTGYPMRMGGIDSDEIIDDEVASIALEKSQELLLSTGFVSYMEGWSNCFHPSKFYEVANRFDNEGKLKLLLSMSYEVEPWQKDMSSQIDYLVSLNEKYGTSHVRPQYLKVFMDGCVEAFTGSMFKPYMNGITYNSHWAVDRLADITRECNSKDITVHTHTMGDKAIAEATDAYAKGGDGAHRNCLVHLRNVRREDYKRFADNNIACVASLTWHVGASAEEEAIMASLVDEEYVKHAYPIKSFFDAGAKVSSHCDFPANGICPQDPFGIMEIAVTGQMAHPYTGAVYPAFDPEELCTLEQALQALTINGAWQLGLDSERGSIKVGKYADFVLADQDVFNCPVTDIHNTKVVSTWFEGEKVYQAEMTKITDYLYEFEAEGYGTKAPTTLLTNDGPLTFGCSAVRNGNFYGRNLDLGISETCEFVVRTKATAERKHASIGVANTCFSNITEDMVQAGLSEELLKFIPWMMMDGVNDAGLVCNINVVNQADIKSVPHTHTNPGKPQIMVMQLVRALLDNCASVAEAKEFIAAHDITPMPDDVAGEWDGHIMIADADNTVIVEFTSEEGAEVKYIETEIMTNFYNHMYEATGAYPPHACGVERYEILKAGYDGGNTMEGMWELMKKVQYTQAYKESTEPFWCSEHIDGVPGGDISWTKEQLLKEAETQKMLKAYKVYEQTGEYNPADGMWFTAHNSIYDIANRILWVTVREKYDRHYEFKL